MGWRVGDAGGVVRGRYGQREAWTPWPRPARVRVAPAPYAVSAAAWHLAGADVAPCTGCTQLVISVSSAHHQHCYHTTGMRLNVSRRDREGEPGTGGGPYGQPPPPNHPRRVTSPQHVCTYVHCPHQIAEHQYPEHPIHQSVCRQPHVYDAHIFRVWAIDIRYERVGELARKG